MGLGAVVAMVMVMVAVSGGGGGDVDSGDGGGGGDGCWLLVVVVGPGCHLQPCRATRRQGKSEWGRAVMREVRVKTCCGEGSESEALTWEMVAEPSL